MGYAYVFQDIKRMELNAVLFALQAILMDLNVLDAHQELILGLVKKFVYLVVNIVFHVDHNLLVQLAKMDFI